MEGGQGKRFHAVALLSQPVRASALAPALPLSVSRYLVREAQGARGPQRGSQPTAKGVTPLCSYPSLLFTSRTETQSYQEQEELLQC